VITGPPIIGYSPMKKNKTGIQSADDPFKFIMSTDTVDRMGDIVKQDWNLNEFAKNPIALWQHNSSFPIGTWDYVRVEGGRLVGKLILAKQGTSRLIDEIRSLIEQRIIQAVSVGFSPGSATPINKEKPWQGSILKNNTLLECSLVSVPANSEALLAKSLSSELRATIQRQASQYKQAGFKMTLAEQIAARKAELEKISGEIEVLKAVSDTELRDMNDAEISEYEKLLDGRDRTNRLIKTLERDESESAARAKANPAPVNVAAIVNVGEKREKGSLLFGALGNMLKGHIMGADPSAVAADNYKQDKDMQAMTQAVTKAAIDPAMTTVPEWAGDLVREGFGEFMNLLKPVSVYPKIPGMRHTFGRNGSIKIPRRDSTPQINGDWIAEGAPIPVKKLGFKSATLTPKKLGVISTYTREIMRASNPQIEQIIRTAMLEDTAEVLDKTFLDNTAGTAIRPAGLKKIADTNTAASAGKTAANILTDIGAAVGALITANMGNSAVWVMNPKHRIGLSALMLANGAFLFRDEVNAGSFAGFPLILSNNVPVGDVFLIDAQALTFANDFAPEFSVSNQATLHMESDVANVAPIAGGPGTGTGGTPGTPGVADFAQPVRSLFQTDTYGIRMVWGLDWAEMRAGGVFYLSGVAW